MSFFTNLLFVWSHFLPYIPACHNLVTTLYQPCDNLVPILQSPCSHVVTRLIQVGHNVVNTWLKWLYYLVTRLSQPSFFYIWECMAENGFKQVVNLWKKTLRSSQDLNLGLLNAGQMLLPTEPLELWHWSVLIHIIIMITPVCPTTSLISIMALWWLARADSTGMASTAMAGPVFAEETMTSLEFQSKFSASDHDSSRHQVRFIIMGASLSEQCHG